MDGLFYCHGICKTFYKNFYYDFIIGGDGELKIVAGRYIP